jgi:hypothetical protein
MSSYSLETICSIMSDGFEYHLAMDAMRQINTMASQLNIVSAQIREPHYVLSPTITKQERDVSQGFQSSTSTFERSKKKKSNKSYDVSNEEWGNVRSFQVTKIEPKKGLNCIIDQIRISLNKLTDKTFLDMRSNIIQIIDSLETLNAEEIEEARERISQDIFSISSRNMFYSKVFADLYAELVISYSWLKPYFDIQLIQYLSKFETLTYVDPNENYDKFCEMNKTNSDLRANSKFYLNLSQNGFIEKEVIISKICELLKMIISMYQDSTKVNIVAEITENIATLYNRELILSFESNPKFQVNETSIMNTISMLAKCKAKDYKGLSNKTIFKYMDLLEL